MTGVYEEVLSRGSVLVELVDEDEGHRGRVLASSDGRRFLYWEGTSEWRTCLEGMLGCGDLPSMATPVHRPTENGFLFACPEGAWEPFDIWRWRSVEPLRCVAALRGVARTLQRIHDAGFALHGIQREEFLLNYETGALILAALPRLRATDHSPETMWRDIRIFAELAYENFLEHEYPGGHQLVTILQDRESMAETGLVVPGLSQLLAGCVTPYGDLAYSDADELLVGLDHLATELWRPLSFRAGARSTQGNHIFRQNNQDSCGHVVVDTICGSRRGRLGFFCVADGIGGIRDGEKASALAVKTACAAFLRAWSHYEGDAIRRAPTEFARRIAQVTSQRLAMEGDFSPRRNRGGTTFSGLLLVEDRAGICHVGDSRIVLVRDGEVVELTRDHTLATILDRLGEVPGEGEEDASHRTISRFFSTGSELELSRIDGLDEELVRGAGVKADGGALRVRSGDLFVLTTDGAHGEVDTEELLRLVALHPGDPQRLCDAIVEEALARIGRDNATAVAVLVE